MSESELLTLARQYAAAAERRDMAALDRLTRAYWRMYRGLEAQIEALAKQIGDGAMTTGQIARLTRFKSLMADIEDGLKDYGVVVRNELSDGADAAVTRALRDSSKLIETAFRESGISAGFNSLPKSTVIQLLGFLQDGSPLMDAIATTPGWVSAEIRDAIIEGVGLGWNPRKIVAVNRGIFGRALESALRTVRTVQMYSYREATRANFVTSDVVVGWQWLANIGSPRTCMACIALSGRVFPKKTSLHDHYNGRCAMIPVIRGRDTFISETEGVDYFNSLPESEQRAQMGPRFHEAWKAGKFDLADMPREVEDEVYGKMWQVTPLRELMGA